MYWVTMTDKFMSGWGKAEGRVNKLVFECDTYEEAAVVAQNASSRGDMRYVGICERRPRYYPKDRYLVQVKTKADYPNWYKPNAFKEVQNG